MSRFRVTYTGNEIVRLEGAGVFTQGTSAYVDEAVAQRAKAMGGFTVEAEGGAAPAKAADSSKPAEKAEKAEAKGDAKAEKADAKVEAKDEKAEAKGDKAEAKAEAPKAEAKKG
jgi:hypothetical protein